MHSSAIRFSALTAGLCYLAMTVLALATAFDPALLESGDAGSGAAALSRRTYALTAIAVLDVVIALGLWRLFRDAGPTRVRTMALARIVYAAFLGFALLSLWSARSALISGADPMPHVLRFERIWDVGFLLFALHLVLLGWLYLGRGRVALVLGVLLIVSGLGYLVDSGLALARVSAPEVAPYTFWGEMALMIWLFAVAFRPGLAGQPASASRAT